MSPHRAETRPLAPRFAVGLRTIPPIAASAVRSHAGLRQAITVLAAFLARNEEYAVVAIDGEENETALGTMKARGRAGLAGLLVDTGRADELPASLADLAGQRVEVRDGDGNVALEGVFPELR